MWNFDVVLEEEVDIVWCDCFSFGFFEEILFDVNRVDELWGYYDYEFYFIEGIFNMVKYWVNLREIDKEGKFVDLGVLMILNDFC